MYSVVLVSNIQVSNAQILIRGKLQGQTSNTDTYYRIGNIINGSNTFNMPKSRKFVSIDSMSILDNIGAGTSVNGSFELKVLHSDHFARYHFEKDDNGNLNLQNKKILNLANPVENSDGANRQWVLGLEGRFLIFGNITKGDFKDNLGNDLKLGPTKFKKISIKSNVVENNAYIRIDPTRGRPSFFQIVLEKGNQQFEYEYQI